MIYLRITYCSIRGRRVVSDNHTWVFVGSVDSSGDGHWDIVSGDDDSDE